MEIIFRKYENFLWFEQLDVVHEFFVTADHRFEGINVDTQYSEQSQDIFTNKLEELHGNFELKIHTWIQCIQNKFIH